MKETGTRCGPALTLLRVTCGQLVQNLKQVPERRREVVVIFRLFDRIFESAESMRNRLGAEAIARSEAFSNDAFYRKRNVVLVAIYLFAALSGISTLVWPPKNLGKQLAENSGNFRLFRDGFIFFSDAKTPPAEGVIKHKISLPFRDAPNLHGYKKDGFWYEFSIQIPAYQFNPGQTGLMIPLVWGQSEVFIDGELFDFGNNNVPILPLRNAKNLLQIRANIEGSNRMNPISATFPLIVGNINELRSLKKKLDSEYEVNFRALTIYSLAILLFGMLFLAFPRKPELLAFITFLSASFLNSILITLNAMNAFPIKSEAVQQTLLVGGDYLANLFLFVFSLYFLRSHPRSVKTIVINVITATLILAPPIAHFFSKAFSANSIVQVALLVVNASFLIAQIAFVCPRLVFSFRERTVPRFRKVACGIVSMAILAFYTANILDYFFIFSGITTLHGNGLILNIALVITVAFEVSRAEKNQKLLSSILPKEVKETLHLERRAVNQQGFVVLVDAVGYAADRNRFDDAVIRNAYIERLAKKMLKPLDTLSIRDFSILSCTGDGIYCAIRGEPNCATLESAIRLAVSVTTNSPEESDIQFRAAIGYGSYSVSVIEAGNVRKEFVAGNVLNDLSRVIGNSTGSHQVRILVSERIRHLVSDLDAATVVDKHGFVHRFVDLEKVKRAA